MKIYTFFLNLQYDKYTVVAYPENMSNDIKEKISTINCDKNKSYPPPPPPVVMGLKSKKV